MPAGAAPPVCPSPVVRVPIFGTLAEAIEHQQKPGGGAAPPPPPPPPPCPSPVVKVPIYRTLAEALEHQQKQQQQQQQQPRQAGAMSLVPPTPPPSLGVRAPPFWSAGPGSAASGVFDGPSTPRCYSPRVAMTPGQHQQQQQQPRGFNDMAMPAPPGFPRIRQQQQQQQQQSMLHRRQNLPAPERSGGAAAAVSGDYGGTDRASPRRTMAPDVSHTAEGVRLRVARAGFS